MSTRYDEDREKAERDPRRNEAIFDGGCARFVAKEGHDFCHGHDMGIVGTIQKGQPENQKGPTSWEPHGKGSVPPSPVGTDFRNLSQNRWSTIRRRKSASAWLRSRRYSTITLPAASTRPRTWLRKRKPSYRNRNCCGRCSMSATSRLAQRRLRE
jgi:hypothetical protein